MKGLETSEQAMDEHRRSSPLSDTEGRAIGAASGKLSPLASAGQRKRSRESEGELDEEEVPSAEELSKMSRSERKRHREKKRRNDVNKGFDELMTLLLEIDPDVRAEAEERARRGQWKGSFGAQEENLLSRVDLISRTVDVLGRVHRENEERKLIIARLLQGASAGTPSSQEVSACCLNFYALC